MPLRDKAWFSYVNHLRADDCEITADSEVATLPATNVIDPLFYRVWRTESKTATLSLYWETAVTFDVIVLAFTAHRDPDSASLDEISPTDQITLAASTVSAGATDQLSATVNSNVNRFRGYFAYVAASPVTANYLDIQIAATSRILDFFDLAYVHVGPIFQPTENISRGTVGQTSEESLINVSPIGGATFSESRGRLLETAPSFGMIDETERAQWHAMEEAVGTTRSIAYGLRTTGDLSRKVFIARFAAPIQFIDGQAHLSSTRVNLIERR